MTAAEEQVLERVKAGPITFSDLKTALPAIEGKVFDALSKLVDQGTLVRVKRTEAGAVFALPGAKIEGRKPDEPGAKTHATSWPKNRTRTPALKPPKPTAPAPPAAIAAALGDDEYAPPQQENPMPNNEDWIDSIAAAELLGLTANYVTSNLKDKIKHQGGGRGNPIQFSRAAVEKFKAERAADAGGEPPPRRAKRKPSTDDLARTVRWLIDGWRLGKLTAVEALDQLAEAVGAE